MCRRSDLEPIPTVPNGPFRAYCGGEIHPGYNRTSANLLCQFLFSPFR
jgi:hypothetical protein